MDSCNEAHALERQMSDLCDDAAGCILSFGLPVLILKAPVMRLRGVSRLHKAMCVSVKCQSRQDDIPLKNASQIFFCQSICIDP